MKGRPFLNLEGQRFGKLIALERVGQNRFRQALWKCKCDCGKETVTSAHYLKTKGTTSCGCARKKLTSEELKKRISDKKRSYYSQNRQRLKAKSQQHYVENRDSHLARSRSNYHLNKDKHRARCKEYEFRNRHKMRQKRNEYQNKWRARNIDHVRAERRKFDAKRLGTIRGSLDSRMSTGIRHSIGRLKGGRSWSSLVGYGVAELRKRLESLFTSGMTWPKLVAGEIHIDHKIPKAKFNYNSPDDLDFKRCWALENLQPLWADDNRKKQDFILEPTQIALGV